MWNLSSRNNQILFEQISSFTQSPSGVPGGSKPISNKASLQVKIREPSSTYFEILFLIRRIRRRCFALNPVAFKVIFTRSFKIYHDF